MSDNLEEVRLTPEQLERLGKYLYGTSFKIQLADSLGVDRRRINHWLDGDRPIPVGITVELLEIAKKRTTEIAEAVHQLEKILKS
ncbi:hypothetical protein MMP65_19330 [Acinetobacter sp. ANC 3926]|uniref:hypothetical protein n=1 Tax=Acinetobacter genomosp. 15BJ TaxID=106651 RepID=UPI001F4B9A11|nr:hypothetical protein [Acinetobacter genomosp. 15BJ]MCH7293587.1 hypothetical protein [Acinetobacter genomosp. 15BJ]